MQYLAYFLGNNTLSQKRFTSNYQHMHRVLPTWMQLKEDGSLLIQIGETDRELFNKYNYISEISPVIQNHNLSSKVTNLFLNSDKNINQGVKNIISFLQNNSYQTINIDLEGVNKDNKTNFLKFIERLKNEMNNYDYKIGLSIPAKTENHVDTGWAGAYDYKKLGELADRIVIMAYDYHWAGGASGPIAPLTWVYDVIDYVIMQIPLEKIFIGIPCYGYDWNIDQADKRARGLSYQQVLNLKNKYNGPIEWDQESETPYYCYVNEEGRHEVWFENINSILKKIELIKKFQIRGAAFWRLGLEPPGLWKELSKF